MTNVKHAVSLRDENSAALALLLARLRMSAEEIEQAHEAHCRFVRNGVSPHAANVIRDRQMGIDYLENLEGYYSSSLVQLENVVICMLILTQRGTRRSVSASIAWAIVT